MNRWTETNLQVISIDTRKQIHCLTLVQNDHVANTDFLFVQLYYVS